MLAFLERLLPRAAVAMVLTVYLVVIAGAVVRATGSGMGCPDWPLCFDRLIPPTDVSQIPPKYLEQFRTEGHGNLLHTWVEYLNRIAGAVNGLVTLVTFLAAFILLFARRIRPAAPLVLLAGVLAFGLVAWLGKVVVDTTLAPRRVTIHFLSGMVFVLACVVALCLIRPGRLVAMSRSLRLHAAAVLVLVLGQIVMGTQVREKASGLADGDCCGGRLEAGLAPELGQHRIFAWVLTAAVLTLWWRLRRDGAGNPASWLVHGLPAVIAVEYAVGMVLVLGGLPPWAQPVHLLLASILAGLLTALLMRGRLQVQAAPSTIAVT